MFFDFTALTSMLLNFSKLFKKQNKKQNQREKNLKSEETVWEDCQVMGFSLLLLCFFKKSSYNWRTQLVIGQDKNTVSCFWYWQTDKVYETGSEVER